MADLDIKVSADLIKGIIEAKVQAAITEAMAKHGGLVERIVSAALTRRVGSDGHQSRYERENTKTYLEYLCQDVLQEGAKQAIALWAEERKEVLREEFLQQLQTKQTSSLLVKACVEGLTVAVQSKWRFSVHFPEK